jgi:hypothetical protein
MPEEPGRTTRKGAVPYPNKNSNGECGGVVATIDDRFAK